MRKTHTDPAFINEYRKLTGGDEPTPLMPDEQAEVVKEIPRDAETIELFKNLPEPDLYRRAKSTGSGVGLTISGTLTWNSNS